MSITPTLHRTFHHRLLCLFSSSCRTSCSCSCSIFCSSSYRIYCTIFCATANPAFPIWSCGTLHRSFSFVPEASHTLRSVADARELFVRTVLFLIGIKSRAAQKSRRCTPCGMISCFIRLFSLAILVPCVLLACFLRSKTDHFRGPRTAPKVLNFPANRRRETYRKVGKIIAC